MILYNTLSRAKEVFQPIKDKKAGLYSCGPTVYNYAHIGNLRTYVFVDIVKRALIFNGYKVKHVMNITDVGHLTSDADAGEDKLEKGAAREQKTVWEIADFYTQAFKNDLAKLNITPPKIWARATDHIKDQIALIKKLQKKGFAYETSKAVYFETAKFQNYGQLGKLKLADQITGAGERLETGVVEVDPEKKQPQDFVLWFKCVGKYADHAMHWPSPWGEGFPGWHIECSAMSMKYLGNYFDIHTGGADHINVHHTNELAQSEAATGVKFVNYWLHGAFLNIASGEKMAKSGENFITLETITRKGFTPLSLRYLILTAHYRSPADFSWESLKAAQNGLHNLYAVIIKIANQKVARKVQAASAVEKYAQDFSQAVNDDLNTAQALAVVWNLARNADVPFLAKKKLLTKFDQVLGLNLPLKRQIIPFEIMQMVNEREQMRAEKNFASADVLRQKISDAGYLIEDTSDGPIIIKLN